MNLAEEINKAARYVAYEWSDVIDRDELTQEMWLVIADRSYSETLLGLNPAARLRTLRKIGHQIAMQYRADYDHYSGQFFYSTTEVRQLLQDGRLNKEKSRTQTEWMDLEEGWAILLDRNPDYSEALVQAYTLGTYDSSTGTARRNLSRAVDALVRCMNSAHKRRYASWGGGVGSRRIRSNGNAINFTRNQLYDTNTAGAVDGYHI